MTSRCPLCETGELASWLTADAFILRRCRACRYLSTRVEPKGRAGFFETFADESAFVTGVGAVRVRQAKRILDALARHGFRSGHLLDVGCGYGWFLRSARARGFDVTGIDSSEASRRLAKEMPVLSGSFSRAAFAGERFDVVTALDVIEHVAADALPAFVDDLRAVLADDGALVLKVPDSRGVVFRSAVAAHRLSGGRIAAPLARLLQLSYAFPHVSYFDGGNLAAFVERRGFRIVEAFGDADFDPATSWARVSYESPPGLLLRGLYATSLAALWGLAHGTRSFDSAIVVARPLTAPGR